MMKIVLATAASLAMLSAAAAADLPRKEPPPPAAEIADWVVLSADPTRLPETRPQRIITVNAVERDAALAKKTVCPEDLWRRPASAAILPTLRLVTI